MKPSLIAKRKRYGVYCYIVLLMTLGNAGCSLLAAKLHAMR